MVCVFQDQQVTTRVVADVVGFLVLFESITLPFELVRVRHTKFSISVIWY